MNLFTRIATLHPAIVTSAFVATYLALVQWPSFASGLPLQFVMIAYVTSLYITARKNTLPQPLVRYPVISKLVLASAIIGSIGSALIENPLEFSFTTALGGVCIAIGLLGGFWLAGDALLKAETSKAGPASSQPASAIVFQLMFLPISVWFLQPRIKRLLRRDEFA